MKFFGALERSSGFAPQRSPAAPLLGISLVAVGTVALVLATIQYLVSVRDLQGERFRSLVGYGSVPRFRPALIVTLALTAVGAITLWALLAMPH